MSSAASSRTPRIPRREMAAFRNRSYGSSHGIYGESGRHLLDERLAQNLLGAACMVAPAFLLLPERTEAVVRRYAALARDAIEAVRADPGAVDQLDHRLALLESAARPALVAHRIARALGLRAHDATAERVARVGATASAARQA